MASTIAAQIAELGERMSRLGDLHEKAAAACNFTAAHILHEQWRQLCIQQHKLTARAAKQGIQL